MDNLFILEKSITIRYIFYRNVYDLRIPWCLRDLSNSYFPCLILNSLIFPCVHGHGNHRNPQHIWNYILHASKYLFCFCCSYMHSLAYLYHVIVLLPWLQNCLWCARPQVLIKTWTINIVTASFIIISRPVVSSKTPRRADVDSAG